MIIMRILTIFGKIDSFSKTAHIRIVYIERFFTIIVNKLRSIGSGSMEHFKLSNGALILFHKKYFLSYILIK